MAVSIDEFNATAVVDALAALASTSGVVVERKDITIEVHGASLLVSATILPPITSDEAAVLGLHRFAATEEACDQIRRALAAFTLQELSASLAVPVIAVGSPYVSTLTFERSPPTPPPQPPAAPFVDALSLSPSADVGLVVGVTVGLLLASGLMLGCYILHRRRRRAKVEQSVSPSLPTWSPSQSGRGGVRDRLRKLKWGRKPMEMPVSPAPPPDPFALAPKPDDSSGVARPAVVEDAERDREPLAKRSVQACRRRLASALGLVGSAARRSQQTQSAISQLEAYAPAATADDENKGQHETAGDADKTGGLSHSLRRSCSSGRFSGLVHPEPPSLRQALAPAPTVPALEDEATRTGDLSLVATARAAAFSNRLAKRPSGAAPTLPSDQAPASAPTVPALEDAAGSIRAQEATRTGDPSLVGDLSLVAAARAAAFTNRLAKRPSRAAPTLPSDRRSGREDAASPRSPLSPGSCRLTDVMCAAAFTQMARPSRQAPSGPSCTDGSATAEPGDSVLANSPTSEETANPSNLTVAQAIAAAKFAARLRVGTQALAPPKKPSRRAPECVPGVAATATESPVLDDSHAVDADAGSSSDSPAVDTSADVGSSSDSRAVDASADAGSSSKKRRAPEQTKPHLAPGLERRKPVATNLERKPLYNPKAVEGASKHEFLKRSRAVSALSPSKQAASEPEEEVRPAGPKQHPYLQRAPAPKAKAPTEPITLTKPDRKPPSLPLAKQLKQPGRKPPALPPAKQRGEPSNKAVPGGTAQEYQVPDQDAHDVAAPGRPSRQAPVSPRAAATSPPSRQAPVSPRAAATSPPSREAPVSPRAAATPSREAPVSPRGAKPAVHAKPSTIAAATTAAAVSSSSQQPPSLPDRVAPQLGVAGAVAAAKFSKKMRSRRALEDSIAKAEAVQAQMRETEEEAKAEALRAQQEDDAKAEALRAQQEDDEEEALEEAEAYRGEQLLKTALQNAKVIAAVRLLARDLGKNRSSAHLLKDMKVNQGTTQWDLLKEENGAAASAIAAASNSRTRDESAHGIARFRPVLAGKPIAPGSSGGGGVRVCAPSLGLHEAVQALAVLSSAVTRWKRRRQRHAAM